MNVASMLFFIHRELGINISNVYNLLYMLFPSVPVCITDFCL